MASSPTDLQSRCDRLRSLHRPGSPLLLPNIWDVATAKAVVAAGFPVVATTSGGVAATLGYEDQEDATSRPAPTACTRSCCGTTDALRRFIGEVNGPVNVVRLDAMARFEEQLASLQK